MSRARKQLGRAEERPETDGVTGERIGAALLSIDHANGRPADETRLPKRLYGPHRRAGRGDDVLDEAHLLALLEDALEPLGRAVALRLLPDDQERQTAGERGGCGEGDGPQLGACEPHGIGSVLGDRSGDPIAERAQQVGPRLEAILVEVVARPPAGAEDEVALEVRVLPKRRCELGAVHCAARSVSRPSASSGAAAAEPSGSETIDPSP